MKKIFIILLFLIPVALVAQDIPELDLTAKPNGDSEYITNNIPSFSFSQPFKVVVDVSGVPTLKDVDPIYIWGFIEGCCGAPADGDFANSPESMRMTKVSDNVWSYVVPSVKAYLNIGYKAALDASAAAGTNGRPAGQPSFGLLVKAKDGSNNAQSANLNFPFTGPVYIKNVFETFPINCSQSDVLTLIYNQDLETDATMKSQSDVYLYATATLNDGSTVTPVAAGDVGNTASLALKKNGTQFTISIIPATFFTVPAGKSITAVNVLLRSKTDATINFGDPQVVKLVIIK